MQIRQAGRDNYQDIQQIAHKTWPHTFGNILSPEQIAYMLEMMYNLKSLQEQVEQRGHVFLLAEDEGGFVGFASYECHYKKETTKIHKIYVMPTGQGKGVGRCLISEIAGMAAESGDRLLQLNVNKHNPAIQFYEKLGFRKVGDECIPIGSGFVMDDVVMELDIKKGFQSALGNPNG